MSELVITRGIPASGKTTWARAWINEAPEKRGRVNRDDLRMSMYGAPMLSWELEESITVAQRAAVLALLDSGRDVVVDDMHLRPKYVREWQRFARAHGHAIWIEEFPVPVEVAIERDAARERTVGEEVIRHLVDKYHQAQRPVPRRLPVPPHGDRRKDAIVKRELFDAHIRDHYDVRYVLDDRQQVVDMWRTLGLTVFQVARGDF